VADTATNQLLVVEETLELVALTCNIWEHFITTLDVATLDDVASG
jgi:hypothetical protein